MTAFTDELHRLELAIADADSGTSGASGVVFHLYQRAVLTGSSSALAAAEARLREVTRQLGPRSDLCLLQAHIDITLHRFGAARSALARSSELACSPFGVALAADLEVQSGNFAAATAGYAAAVEQDRSWDNLARLAHLNAVLGQFATADELYLAAEDELTAKQMRAYAWLELQRGQLAFKRGDFDCAAERYARASKACSGYWLVDDYRAELLAAQHRWHAARALYEDIVGRVDRPELWHALGDVTRGGGDAPAAAAYHARALRGYLHSVELGEQHYLHHLADFYLDVCQDTQSALRYARMDVELRSNPWTLSLFAWATFLDRRPADALEPVNRAAASGIVNAELFGQWAAIYQSNDRHAEAKHFAAASAQLNPRLGEFHVHR